MVRYNYSLDVGESVKTDEELKEKQKDAPACGCSTPAKPAKLSDEDKIKKESTKEQKENSSKENPEQVEEETLEEIPEPKKQPEPDKKQEQVEITPISFEKAKLVSDYVEEKQKEPVPCSEKDTEENIEEGQIEKQEEEDEKDVNEFLEDSFSKEAEQYAQYNNKKTKTPAQEPPKKSIWPVILLIILIGAAAFGYGYALLKEPAGAATTHDAVAPHVKQVIELQNSTDTNITKEKKIIKKHRIEKPPEMEKQQNKTVEQALEQFTLGLKD